MSWIMRNLHDWPHEQTAGSDVAITATSPCCDGGSRPVPVGRDKTQSGAEALGGRPGHRAARVSQEASAHAPRPDLDELAQRRATRCAGTEPGNVTPLTRRTQDDGPRAA